MSCKTDLSLLRTSSAGFTTGAPGSVSPLQPLTRSFTVLNCSRRTNLLLTVLIKHGNLEQIKNICIQGSKNRSLGNYQLLMKDSVKLQCLISKSSVTTFKLEFNHHFQEILRTVFFGHLYVRSRNSLDIKVLISGILQLTYFCHLRLQILIYFEEISRNLKKKFHFPFSEFDTSSN